MVQIKDYQRGKDYSHVVTVNAIEEEWSMIKRLETKRPKSQTDHVMITSKSTRKAMKRRKK